MVIHLNLKEYRRWFARCFCLFEAIFRLDKSILDDVRDILKTSFNEVVYDAFARSSDHAARCPAAYNLVYIIVGQRLPCAAVSIHLLALRIRLNHLHELAQDADRRVRRIVLLGVIRAAGHEPEAVTFLIKAFDRAAVLDRNERDLTV